MRNTHKHTPLTLTLTHTHKQNLNSITTRTHGWTETHTHTHTHTYSAALTHILTHGFSHRCPRSRSTHSSTVPFFLPLDFCLLNAPLRPLKGTFWPQWGEFCPRVTSC